MQISDIRCWKVHSSCKNRFKLCRYALISHSIYQSASLAQQQSCKTVLFHSAEGIDISGNSEPFTSTFSYRLAEVEYVWSRLANRKRRVDVSSQIHQQQVRTIIFMQSRLPNLLWVITIGEDIRFLMQLTSLHRLSAPQFHVKRLVDVHHKCITKVVASNLQSAAKLTHQLDVFLVICQRPRPEQLFQQTARITVEVILCKEKPCNAYTRLLHPAQLRMHTKRCALIRSIPLDEYSNLMYQMTAIRYKLYQNSILMK